MSKHPPTRPYRLYPAYCFRASPTFDTWVKITAADVQALRSEPEFQGQRIYFHLNHPIRYVRIVGVVVAIDDISLKYTVLTIDDGSGANIELKIVRTSAGTHNPKSTPTSTQIDNINVISRFGVFEVMVDHQCLDIGSIIKAKGTISEFRGIKQLDLKRIWVVSTTNEEAQAWAETTTYKLEVLSTPWHINSLEHKKIKDSIKAEKKKVQDNLKQDMEQEGRRAQRRKDKENYLAQRNVKLEYRRRREETMMNAGALV